MRSVAALQDQCVSSAVLHHPDVSIIQQQHTVSPATTFEEHRKRQLHLQKFHSQLVEAVVYPVCSTENQSGLLRRMLLLLLVSLVGPVLIAQDSVSTGQP